MTAAPADAASIFVEEPFDLILTIKNIGACAVERCSVLLPCNTETSVIPLGLTEIPVPTLAPGASLSLTVHMLAIEHGAARDQRLHCARRRHVCELPGEHAALLASADATLTFLL